MRSEELSPYDADDLVIQGAQLIPHNRRSEIFHYGQQGVVLGKNKRLIFAVRHSEGHYDDDLNELGEFSYQPPNNTAGMLRYRWCEFLSEKLQTPYIMIVILWYKFKIEEKTDIEKEPLNHVFMIAPAKIIREREKNICLNKSLEKPLELKIITREEALGVLRHIFTLDTPEYYFKNRPALSEDLAREWEYNKIKTGPKSKKIKNWAKQNGKFCVSCKKEFKDVNITDMVFGHIIPQDWEDSFKFLGMKIHHPYNLYLSCRECNSELGGFFPQKSLSREIVNIGTIGDWIRENEKEIRGF